MERHDRLTARTVAVVLAAAVAGLFFAPVFGPAPLLVPVAVPAAVVLAVVWACSRRAGAADWRPLLATVAGLLAVAETVLFSTTVAGLPTGRTLRALADGVTRSGQLVLQSTWPARPDPELLIFVPLLVVVAAVLGAEVLLRLRAPLLALLPSLAVVVLSQLYAALSPGAAAVAALGYAVLAGVALASAPTVLRVAAAAAVSVLVAGLTLVFLPAAPARYSLHDGREVPLLATPPENPLDQIADRLAHPGIEVFRVSGASEVDRWPLVVLDGFDGVNWTASWDYRRFGTELTPAAGVTVGTRPLSAELTVDGLAGPWLPSQPWPASVEGVAPYVAQRYGSLLMPDFAGATRYKLFWWQPRTDLIPLADAEIDATVTGLPIATMPEDLEEVVEKATLGQLPSFRTALLIEDYLNKHYDEAQDEDLPTGHGWPQIRKFLLVDRRGTSEQFAAAYVALARFAGIPARLAVGFRMPARPGPDGTVVVHNSDVLAWPEVAVKGFGWVPLDPTRTATGSAAATGLAAQTELARTQLPPPEDLLEPTPPKEVRRESAEGEAPATTTPWVVLLAVPLVPLAGVPLAWTLRSWRRRRRAGVLDAWAEVRDRLRAYGVPVTPAMTVREVSIAAGSVTDPGTVEEIRRLAADVDRALWSGEPEAGADAWASVRTVRTGLARRGIVSRARAMLDPRPLLPVTAYRSRRGSPSADS